MPATLPDRQYAMPAAADGAACVLPGVAWTNSDFEELLAAADGDLILTGIVARPTGTIFTGYELEVDIATGAAASEVVIATFRFYLQQVLASVGAEGLYAPTVIGVDNIPSGERVSARWRANTTTTPTLHVSATYLKKPLAGSLDTTPNPLLCVPSSAGNFVVTTNATAWVSGTAVEIRGATGPFIAIVGLIAKIDVATTEFELDICTGAGNDVQTTVRGSGAGVSSFPNYFALEHPLIVADNTRISARSRCEDALALNVLVSLSYFELPL